MIELGGFKGWNSLESKNFKDEKLTQLCHDFKKNGWVVIEKAIDDATIKKMSEEIYAYIDSGKAECSYWDESGKVYGFGTRDDFKKPECKILDLHYHLDGVQKAIFNQRLLEFFDAVMESKPNAFQSLYFEYGSGQGAHQDTAFVITEPPMNLLATWIALEDVQPESGELFYFDKSHNLPHILFEPSKRKKFDREDPISYRYSDHLVEQCNENGFEKLIFRPKKGDVLVWSADLVHGGEPNLRDVTRRSFVTHYCCEYSRPDFQSTFAPVKLENGCTISRQNEPQIRY
ncbi:phytanoyl-CoA dioxygenase family protein [Burkholderia ubonensis]|uniref:phytanoyl-CoA dioxygenase family protein n=1 Tax=Burkholderia ubonensis TaxID=101571 RepID=UPI0008FE5B05|nr:phytanoyl-CoA dioxygenase family protein [Burkholderia ubonensis]OJA26980.1 hypothetical protein BGX87_21540 [Burkholderia ubonensis]